MKFGSSEAELSLRVCHQLTPYKEFTGGGVKFGQGKPSSPSSSSSRKSGQRSRKFFSSARGKPSSPSSSSSKKSGQKKHEVLPRKLSRESGTKFGASEAESTSNLVIGIKFGSSEAELPLGYVTKEAPYKEFIGGGMKFGQAKPGSTSSSSSRKSGQKKHEVLPWKLSRKSGTKFGASEGGMKSSRGMKFSASEAELPPQTSSSE
ncbi:hypothetical protein COCNU_13G007630 [Cocos nucifera]|uniref:Uncharacterized protein n=1 Tax=Cocos nucifera TaxID=13894 RepID=A0A8K0IU17_COCNU|nr:hypothetical protein COCNU_13G007630 [Cocos nucifera]